MKFSHSLQFNAVPDWSNHYIAYSNLKKQYVSGHFGWWLKYEGLN
jgi:SPX domain protein involved in polyphosphate accumulation